MVGFVQDPSDQTNPEMLGKRSTCQGKCQAEAKPNRNEWEGNERARRAAHREETQATVSLLVALLWQMTPRAFRPSPWGLSVCHQWYPGEQTAGKRKVVEMPRPPVSSGSPTGRGQCQCPFARLPLYRDCLTPVRVWTNSLLSSCERAAAPGAGGELGRCWHCCWCDALVLNLG